MPLTPGEKLGPYEILAPIGAGGMGEVYKARDTRLDRTVAVKVLPEHIAGREDLRTRFEREARAVASLNHPHICTLHDIGPGYMVMELVEGETLAARIAKGPLPLEQALKYAAQIADALDRAHRAGVTHRDIKPQNIMVTRDGVKILDFGLAKASSKPGPSDATLTAGLTAEGAVMGTPQYMAPELFEGREADARADIWAFGAVLHEMVTGRKAFEGKSYSSLVGAILSADLAPFTPAWLDRLVRRCLAKDPEDRWQSMRDVLLELLTPPLQQQHARPTPPPWWLAAALIPAAVFAWLWISRAAQPPPIPAPLVRFEVPVPGESWVRVHRLELSPDGQHLALIAANSVGRRQIFLRRIDGLESKPVRNTEGALQVFWSGDSRALAFADGGRLRRVDLDGGNQITITPASPFGGGAWSRNGVVLFRPNGTTVLQQIPAQGGTASAAAGLGSGQPGMSLGFPSFLPDGRHFVFHSVNAAGQATIELAELGSNERKRVMEARNPVVCVIAPGGETYLAYQREQSLMVQAFDGRSGVPKGEPVLIVDNLGEMAETIPFSFSETGTLAYTSTNTLSRRLTWYNRAGAQLSEIPSNGTEQAPALSPDGNRLAVMRSDGAGSKDIWVADLARQAWMRVSFGAEAAINPVWSPDGKRIAYTVGGSVGGAILETDSSGTGRVREIGKGKPWPQHWSPDGRFILYVDYEARALLAMPVQGDPKPIAIAQTKATYYPASYSPDGKFITYTSGESGRQEVYVMAVPPAQGKWLISTGGGGMSAWRGDGREIFYVGEDLKMMAVDVKLSPAFEVGTPHPLFQTNLASLMDGRNHVAVSGDGQRFLISSPAKSESASFIKVVLNWPALLRTQRTQR